ncbi:META domain-containing protein [Desertivirga arenae]|uniref:META domain-containing protein n=1 Tax=Desertivirga arenae TaxID=2810309 RepID=UPI001A97AA95|nr:META domain-containing protein [Pedobacter sp. SYSU D00823]
MKLYLPLFFILILFSCNALKPENEVIGLDGHRWVLTAIKHKPVVTNKNAFLEFSKKQEVSGKAFCNSIKGDFTLMGKDQLTFEGLISTKMYCDGVMDLENEMVSSLENVKRYEIKNRMLYLYNSDNVLLTFKKGD